MTGRVWPFFLATLLCRSPCWRPCRSVRWRRSWAGGATRCRAWWRVGAPPGSEIAEELNLSVKTVSTYRSRVLPKLGLRNNAEIMRYFLQHELIRFADR